MLYQVESILTVFCMNGHASIPCQVQLERLRSEDTPRRLMITHTIESYWITESFLNFETGITRDTPSEVAW